MSTTKHEKIILVALGILFVLFLAFPALLDPDYEMLYLLFIVLPLGILLITDKERKELIDKLHDKE